jgi:ferric-dicitrate binding protein FerR (iron transport regulator)
METLAIDINEIIIRYLDGSASFEEKVKLLQWLKHSDENRDDFITTRDLWFSCSVIEESELEVDIALDRLKSRIMSQQEQIKPSIRRFHWTQIAATLLLLLGLSYWFTVSDSDIVVQNQLITADGSKGRFTLPDGSVVWLNSGTKLTYLDQFVGDKRLVSLEGGAYFEVAKDEEKPFVVQMDKIDVEVLGTNFNISNYANKDIFETTLLSGSVKIMGEAINKEVTLLPNQLFEYHRLSHKSSVNPVKAILYADWIKDRLVFDNQSLSDVFVSMEGWYNVKIECPEAFATQTKVSFTIRQESLEEILEAMTYITPINYRLTTNNVYIEPK